MRSDNFLPRFILLLILVVLASAALACRLAGEPDVETTMVEEQAPPPIEPTEAVETEPEPTIVVETEPEPEIEETAVEAQVGGISPEDIIHVEPGAAPVNYQPGDVIAIADQIIMVLGWEILPEPENEYFAPDPGTVYAIVEMIVVNTGSTPSKINTYLQTSLKTVVNGVEEDVEIDFQAIIQTNGGIIIDDELLPGERVRAKLGYQLPQEVSGILFTYEPISFQSDQVTFDLGSEPVLFPPPAFFPGETPQAVYAMGEIIEINDLILQVNDFYIQPGRHPYIPSEGYQYVIIDITLTTNSPSPVEIRWNQTHLRDKTGLTNVISISAMAVVSATVPEGEYSQGETIEFSVGYEVPKTETEFLLLVDGDDWDAGLVRIGLSLE